MPFIALRLALPVVVGDFRKPLAPEWEAKVTDELLLRFAGLLDESANQCDTAFSLDPKNPSTSLSSCAMVFLLQKDYEHTLNFLNHYRDYYSGTDFATSLSIDILLRQGKEQEALQLGLAHTPQWAGYDMVLAHLRHKSLPEINALAASVSG